MRRSKQTYQSEPMIMKIYKSLVKDLKPIGNNPYDENWFSPRSYTGPRYDYWEPYDFKRHYQLQHFFKRVLLSSDPDFETLKMDSLWEFVRSQTTFGLPDTTQISARVIERARTICADILGEFDYTEFFKACSFGKRAAFELPYRESYLDTRLSTLNGTIDQIEWFKVALCEDIHLHRACRLGLKQVKRTDFLEMKAVPKTFKAARIMAPDTTVGGFLSRGLGVIFRERLERGTHINLATQQYYHRQLAKAGSVDGQRCTIDMKRASDSYVWDHIVALVPESWWPVLDTVRVDKVLVDERIVEIRSCMLMGSGHTFPLQTILFYSIVKAVLELMGSSANVDVYGDDIIFPSEYSQYVVHSLHALGFTVNEEKSFVEGPFRESCGGDYHTGVDVRPFMPEHVCGKHSAYEYTECLHKWYNGLYARWDYCEAPETFDLILLEIVRVWGNLCPIPDSDPDTMGLKFIPPKFQDFTRPPVYKHGIWHYLRLTRTPAKRKPKRERGYYWNWFHQKAGMTFVPSLYDEGQPILDRNGREPVKGSKRIRWLVS